MAGNIGDFSRHFPVERLDHRQALKQLRPQLVVCSWMSLNLDLSETFRKAKFVHEYVLIGEVDYGVSGKPWETWGVGGQRGAEPSYSQQGFDRIPLADLSLLQIARSDTPHVRFHSQTTVFRRTERGPNFVPPNTRQEL